MFSNVLLKSRLVLRKCRGRRFNSSESKAAGGKFKVPQVPISTDLGGIKIRPRPPPRRTIDHYVGRRLKAEEFQGGTLSGKLAQARAKDEDTANSEPALDKEDGSYQGRSDGRSPSLINPDASDDFKGERVREPWLASRDGGRRSSHRTDINRTQYMPTEGRRANMERPPYSPNERRGTNVDRQSDGRDGAYMGRRQYRQDEGRRGWEQDSRDGRRGTDMDSQSDGRYGADTGRRQYRQDERRGSNSDRRQYRPDGDMMQTRRQFRPGSGSAPKRHQNRRSPQERNWDEKADEEGEDWAENDFSAITFTPSKRPPDAPLPNPAYTPLSPMRTLEAKFDTTDTKRVREQVGGYTRYVSPELLERIRSQSVSSLGVLDRARLAISLNPSIQLQQKKIGIELVKSNIGKAAEVQ